VMTTTQTPVQKNRSEYFALVHHLRTAHGVERPAVQAGGDTRAHLEKLHDELCQEAGGTCTGQHAPIVGPPASAQAVYQQIMVTFASAPALLAWARFELGAHVADKLPGAARLELLAAELVHVAMQVDTLAHVATRLRYANRERVYVRAPTWICPKCGGPVATVVPPHNCPRGCEHVEEWPAGAEIYVEAGLR
jgi:hypothetical protein